MHYLHIANNFWNNPDALKAGVLYTRERPYMDKTLPRMPSRIEQLLVWHAPNLVELCALPETTKILELENCPQLKTLVHVPDTLSRLKLVNTGAIKFKKLPSQLSCLIVKHIPNLAQFLPDLPDSLETLELESTGSWLPKFPNSLKSLTIRNCPIDELPSKLPDSLENLSIEDCAGLRTLPNLPASLKWVAVFSSIQVIFKVGETSVIMRPTSLVTRPNPAPAERLSSLPNTVLV